EWLPGRIGRANRRPRPDGGDRSPVLEAVLGLEGRDVGVEAGDVQGREEARVVFTRVPVRGRGGAPGCIPRDRRLNRPEDRRRRLVRGPGGAVAPTDGANLVDVA